MKEKKINTATSFVDYQLKKVGPAKIFDKIAHQIAVAESTKTINEVRAQRDEVWSELSNQVIGAENLKG